MQQIMLCAYYVLGTIWDIERHGVHKKIFSSGLSQQKGDQKVSQQWPNRVKNVLLELWIVDLGALQEQLTQPGSSISGKGQMTLIIEKQRRLSGTTGDNKLWDNVN